MATLVRPTPVLRVSRKELELVVRIQTDQDFTFEKGETYQLTIEGDEDQSGAVRIVHANYMTRGVTREWTLTVAFA